MLTEVQVSGILKAIKLIRRRQKHLDSCTCAEMRAPPFHGYKVLESFSPDWYWLLGSTLPQVVLANGL